MWRMELVEGERIKGDSQGFLVKYYNMLLIYLSFYLGLFAELQPLLVPYGKEPYIACACASAYRCS